jgi:hypothetical protein
MEYAGRPASRESISLLPARGGFNPTELFYSMYIQSKAFCFIFMPKVTKQYKNKYIYMYKKSNLHHPRLL